MKIKNLLIGLPLLFALSGCGPSESELDEAYNAGYRSIWNEKCRGIEQPLMMPSQYDDSTGRGKLADAYRSGMAAAQFNPYLCD